MFTGCFWWFHSVSELSCSEHIILSPFCFVGFDFQQHRPNPESLDFDNSPNEMHKAELALISCAQARFSSSPNLQEKASLKSSVQDHFHIDIRHLEHTDAYMYLILFVYVCMCVVCVYCIPLLMQHMMYCMSFNMSRVLFTYIYTLKVSR